MRAVDDIPPAGAQPFAQRIGRFEVLGQAKAHTLAEKALGLTPIHGAAREAALLGPSHDAAQRGAAKKGIS